MAHRVIEDMQKLLEARRQALTRLLQEQAATKDAYDRRQKDVTTLTEDISHLSAVIQLAEKGHFIDPPGPAKTEVSREEEEVPAAIPVSDVQRLRESPPAED